MAAQWYFRNNGKAQGPYSVAELKQFGADGLIAADTPIRKGEDGAWSRADRIAGLLRAPASGSSVATKSTSKLLRAEPLPKAAAPKPAVRAVAAAPAVAQAVRPAFSTESGAHGAVRHERRRGSPLPLIVAGVVLGVMLIGGGGLAAILFFTASEEPAVAEVDPASSDNVDSSPTMIATSAPSEEGVSPATSSAPVTDRAAGIAGIKAWKPAVSANGATTAVSLGKMRVQYKMAWLGTSAERDVTGPELVSPGSRPKFLFVRLLITNQSATEPLEFPGWNDARRGNEALLLDEHGEHVELLPLDEVSTSRLVATTLAPRAEATDVLIYRLTRDEFKHFRLAIPFTGERYFGIQIERSMLAKPGQPSDANELVIGTPAAEEEEEDPVLDLPVDEPEPTEPMPPKEPVADEPPAEAPSEDPNLDLNDLRRSIEEQAGEKQP